MDDIMRKQTGHTFFLLLCLQLQPQASLSLSAIFLWNQLLPTPLLISVSCFASTIQEWFQFCSSCCGMTSGLALQEGLLSLETWNFHPCLFPRTWDLQSCRGVGRVTPTPALTWLLLWLPRRLLAFFFPFSLHPLSLPSPPAPTTPTLTTWAVPPPQPSPSPLHPLSSSPVLSHAQLSPVFCLPSASVGVPCGLGG